MIPRPVVILVVLVLLALLSADIGGQFVFPGHTASPVIDGGIIALIGAIITGAKGPKPEAPPTLEAEPSAPVPTPTAVLPAPRQEVGRHHHRSEGPP